MEPRTRFQGINSANLCSLADRYDNPIPTRFLAPIDCFKIPAQGVESDKQRRKYTILKEGKSAKLFYGLLLIVILVIILWGSGWKLSRESVDKLIPDLKVIRLKELSLVYLSLS
jgi:hypothetical protein